MSGVQNLPLVFLIPNGFEKRMALITKLFMSKIVRATSTDSIQPPTMVLCTPWFTPGSHVMLWSWQHPAPHYGSVYSLHYTRFSCHSLVLTASTPSLWFCLPSAYTNSIHCSLMNPYIPCLISSHSKHLTQSITIVQLQLLSVRSKHFKTLFTSGFLLLYQGSGNHFQFSAWAAFKIFYFQIFDEFVAWYFLKDNLHMSPGA